MRTLILGARGVLGSAIAREARERGFEVLAWGREELDVTRCEAVAQRLGEALPDVVVNCTAFHKVDEAQREPEQAHRVNVEAVSHLAEVCNGLGALFVHVSSDYVFDGQKREPYVESDVARPINVYGITKLTGEYMVEITNGRHLIVRTSGLFGGEGRSQKGGDFIRKILARARAPKVVEEGMPIRVVDDLTFSPTYVPDLAVAILDLVEQDVRGIVHVASSGQTTWAEFAQEALTLAGLRQTVCRIKARDLIGAAPRPAYSVLGTERGVFGGRLEGFAIGLKQYVHTLSTGKEAAECPPRT